MNRKNFLKSIGLITGALFISPQLLIPKSIPEPTKFSEKVWVVKDVRKKITIQNIAGGEEYYINRNQIKTEPIEFINRTPEIGDILWYQDKQFITIGTRSN